jgi:hypothetical protein
VGEACFHPSKLAASMEAATAVSALGAAGDAVAWLYPLSCVQHLTRDASSLRAARSMARDLLDLLGTRITGLLLGLHEVLGQSLLEQTGRVCPV